MRAPGRPTSYDWSIHQLTEYLVSVSNPTDPASAIVVALDRGVEALDAELGVVIIDGEVRGSLGFGRQEVPEALQGPVSADETVVVPGLGTAYLAQGDLRAGATQIASDSRLVIGRLHEEYTAEETQLVKGMALVLGLVLHNLETLLAERSRHLLVERLLAIQRAISARRPLREVLDAITAGASALLDGCPVALLLSSERTPGALLPASLFDFPDLDGATLATIHEMMAAETPATHRPSSEDQPVLVERVVVGGELAGCLAARTDEHGRGRRDQSELLAAFAQQVSLALTDSRTLDAVRAANHDSITGLPNRPLFLERLEQARRAAVLSGHALTVLFVDLDRFKSVNDTLGHPAGDELLAEVGRRITACANADDIVARLGGDEFSVLLEGAGVDIAEAVAGRIITALTRGFVISGRDVLIGASVGIAPLTPAHEDATTLLSDADVAMYFAKRAGRGRCVVFEPRMHDEVADRLDLRADLQHLSGSGPQLSPDAQLWLAYQPIVRIDSGRIDGVEALMRWNHPVRGPVPPSDFIPIAEETEAILVLGAWALAHALVEVAGWRHETPSLRLSLNVSPRQIADPTLPGVIVAALDTAGLPPEALTLEISEPTLVSDLDSSRIRLTALKDLGVRLALDTFGTGYSSLSYLRESPIDQVKIDRSLVAGLRPGATAEIAIVRSVVELCQRLGLQTVGVGIETPEQLAVLTELGCDLGQGYHFARPMPPPRWPGWVRASETQGGRTAGTRPVTSVAP